MDARLHRHAHVAALPAGYRPTSAGSRPRVALPILAVLGVVNAGWGTVLHAAVVPGFSATHSPSPAQGAAVAWLTFRLQLVYLTLLAGVLVLRALRNAHERHTKGVEIDYRAVRRVTVPRGFSILEASRWAAIPHASVCGGRGRCTTCRVRVWRSRWTTSLRRLAVQTCRTQEGRCFKRHPAGLLQVRPTA